LKAKFTAGSLAHIENEKGEVLLVLPRFARGVWGLPGGFHKRREDSLAALIREVREETGLLLKENDVTARGQYRQNHSSHYDHLFTAIVSAPQYKLGPSGLLAWCEIKKVEWFDIHHPELCPDLNDEAKAALAELGRVDGYEVE
jgi:8-oxo-dGTP pyrophosphatase MutT (NUDIX family)